MDVVELGEWWQIRLPIEVGLGKEPMGNKQHVDVNCNQWKTKKWDVGVTITNEKEELLLVTWEF